MQFDPAKLIMRLSQLKIQLKALSPAHLMNLQRVNH
jgi:hypothetical protein